MSKNTEIKLNIGCGYLNTPKNWVNIDNSFSARIAKYPLVKKFLYKIKILPKRLYELPWPDNIMICDLRKRLPFEDSTVKYIYTSHLLEHLTRNETEFLLKECYRVLRNEGVIRIIIPDLQSKIGSYISKMQQIKLESIDSDVAPADEFLDRLGLFDKVGKVDPFVVRFAKILQGNKNLHKWLYDSYSLSSKLKQCGFVRVVQKEYLDSQIEDIDFIDNPDRFRDSICIEASKE